MATRPIPDASASLETRLRQLSFSETAPKRLREAAQAGAPASFCRALRRSWPLRRPDDARDGPIDVSKVRPPGQSTLATSRAAFGPGDNSLSWRERLLWDWWAGHPPAERLDSAVETGRRRDEAGAKTNGRARKRKRPRADRPPLVVWLEQLEVSGTPPTAAELLAAFDLLERIGPALPDDVLAPLWNVALGGIESLTALCPPGWSGEATAADLCDLPLIVSGELPLKAGLFFAHVEGMTECADRGRVFLNDELQRLTDASGVPTGPFVDHLARVLAPFARSAAWAAACGTNLWSDEAGLRFRGLLKAVAAMCRRDGNIALDRSAAAPSVTIELLHAAARASGLRAKSRPRLLLDAIRNGTGRRSRKPSGKDRRRMAEVLNPEKRTSFQSDRSLVACLRSDWTPFSDFFAVVHDRPWPQIEQQTLGACALAGAWELDVSVDGRPLLLGGGWQSTCWFSDDDADYLELQGSLLDGARIERQILLSRAEHFMVLADCVSGVGPGRLEHRSRLPIAPGVTVERDAPTRECRIVVPGTGRKRFPVRVFPLALDDDRLRSAAGSLDLREGALELRQSGAGGLFAPVVLDWHPDRRQQPADWRRLTVGELGKSLPGDVASGHRLRIGTHQLLVYRAIVSSGELRSVLGYHTQHETVIGQLDAEGDLEPLLLVE